MSFLGHFYTFWANENLPEKSSSVKFECLCPPHNFIKKKSEENNDTILRK